MVPAEAVRVRAAPSAAVRVLLIGDGYGPDPLARELIDALEQRGFDLDRVARYDLGLAQLRQGRHAVCLLDERLGTRTGLELLRDAQRMALSMPIILLASEASPASENAAIAAGAADFLVKDTLDVNGLARALRSAMQHPRSRGSAHEHDPLLRAIFEDSLDAIVLSDDSGHYLDANQAALDLFGIDRARLLRSSVCDFLPEAARAPYAAGWKQLLRDGTQDGELEIVRPDGALRRVDSRARAHILPHRHLTILRDVSERRRADITRGRLAAIVESTEDAILAKDLDGTILEWNAGAERLYGCSAADAIGRSFAMFVPPDRLEEWHETFRLLRAGKQVRQLETVRQRKDGTRLHVSMSMSPLRDTSGAVVGSSTIARDLTETRSLRERLATADRMASVGTLAAGVAHEINNPLTAVIGNLSVAMRFIEDGVKGVPQRLSSQDVLDTLRDADQAAQRVAEIVRDVKLFSRPDEELKAPVDIVGALESSLRMVWNEVRHRARLVKDFSPVPTIDGNEGRLGQVFLNLLVNAAQAIPEGHAEDNEIRMVTRSEADRVIVEVSDSGSGIEPDRLARIFEPFFTTKPLGQGTGLGLSICRDILSRIGGEITVVSQVGKGTTFRVSMPQGVLTAAPAATAPGARPAGHPARVLVIDDEPLLVKLIERTLGEHHQVVGTCDAREALGRIEAGERYDLILCDLMMPELTGMDVYQRLHEVAPEEARKMVFLTGGAFTPRARAFLDDVPNRRLEKPFKAEQLVTLVQDLVP